jgi:lysophospholipase L1-like esterase
VQALLGAVAVVMLVAAIALAGGGIFATAGASASATASEIAAASPAPPDSPTPAPTPTETPTASPTQTPTAAPTAPPLPALLAAIGDSYSQAYSVSPQYRYDHPQFSWVVGTSKDDGVLSLLERFQAIGASPVVVDAATSGRKMIDAPRQANLVVAAAKKLGAGQTAYVTFALGTNDLCDDPKTATASFDSQVRTAVGILRAGLPPGSRILMLPVPDFPHFHAMTQADPATKAALLLTVNSSRCPPYLGTFGPSTTAGSNAYLAAYDASLQKVCAEIDAAEGAGGSLHCTYNAALLADSDFTARDLSTADYFHPSLTGQAKMAEGAWRADAWASIPLP